MSIDNDDLKIRNARDLVARILNHPQGGIDALLRLAEDQETDWLECKAALHPVGGVFEPGENADDYRWHVAKAAVALANSCGGVVLLGLNDALCPVGLAPSDPRGVLARKGREAFNRDVVLAPLVSTCWKTGTSGTIKLLGSMERLIEIRNADYRGQPLAAILVAPVPDNDLLELSELREFREGREKYTYTRHLIPIRAHGAVGQVRELQGKEIRVHERARANQLNSDRYDQLWQRFLASLPDDIAPAELIDARVEQALADYHTACVQEGRSLRDLFTPLDVEEDPSSSAAAHAGEFVPEAEEWRDLFASDDPWDTNDADENDDDEEEDRDDTEPDDSAEEPPPAPPRRGQVFELLAQEPRAILLGEPGAGKSTCLLRLALTQAEEYRAGAPMVLYAPLRHYTEQGLTALLARLGRQPWPVLEALIRVGRLRLLLDAVNECPRHLQPRCCQDIKALLEAHPALPVILSTRGLSYRCQLRLPTFVVRPLDREQQQRFLTTYLRGDAARATALLQRIQNQPGGALIASNPLLLRIIVEVSRTLGELPRGRALLYRRLVEDWYQREATKEAHTGAALRWSFPRTREALATLALAARQAGRIEMERAWAIRALRPLLADDAMPFLERMAQGLLLQLDAEQDNLSFNHETVQEYLAAEALIRQPEALAEAPTDMTSSWHMPLAYAFELETDPPAALVREAWRREPLLVAAALRDTARLSALLIAEGGDPWLTGVLRTLRGEPCDAESERIAHDLLYPPVHSLPEALTEALASQAFWYAGLTHDAGIQRLEGLRRLITEREEPWLDLLPLVCHGHPQWKQHLNPAQQAVIAIEEGENTQNKKIIEDSLNINEIILLRRKSLLGENQISQRRKRDLIQQATPIQLLLIAGANIVIDIPADKMRNIFDSITDCHWDWLIQVFLLTGNSKHAAWLFRKRALFSEDSFETSHQQWITRADVRQAVFLLQSGLISSDEIPEDKRHKWIYGANIQQARVLLNTGLISPEDIPVSKRQQWIASANIGQARDLLKADLISSENIPAVKRQQWVASANIGRAAFLLQSGLISFEDIPKAKRQQWISSANIEQARVLLKTGLISSDGIPATKGREPIKKIEVKAIQTIPHYGSLYHTQFDVPAWWQAWQFFAPRWAMAAEGRYQLQANAFNKLKAEGFDVARLQAWCPGEKEGRRIQLTQHIIARALKEPLENRSTRKQHIAQQLAGDGVWADLRQLAEAYLDGKAVFAGTQDQPAAVALDTQPVSRSVRPLFANQRRKIEGQKLLPDLKSRLPLQAAQTDLAGFLDASPEWTLYLDEAWFVPQEGALKRNEAVMAGVLCQGGPQRKLAGLPELKTHSYEKPLEARNALASLAGCREVLPLILHLRLPGDEPANNYYDTLLQKAIRFVLGWLLPRLRSPLKLYVFPEAIAPAHPERDTAAEFYRGLLASDLTGRFAHWRVEAFRWKEKNFGYIPYADLLAHLTLEHTEFNRALGAWANFKHWPGYVPFSLELVPRLERLEHLETSANLGDVIDFAVETGQSLFGRLVMRDLAARLAPRPDLQQRLLETLEEGYRDKVRDLRRLRQAFAAVRGLLPALPEEASPRMRLLWYLLALQDANHDGDPERIRATAGDYLQERETLKQNERELCADADLNLAVHYADRFAFGHAEVTVGEWITDPLFAALSPRQQGRLYSAFGQYRAMQGDAQGADRFFLKALDRFGQATLSETERAGECEQTNIYRAINALDGALPVAHDALEAVFGPLTPALAERFAADGTLANQYRHHLLLRALTLRPELDELRLAYLAARDRWQTGHAQHPWPGIHGYRGFLLWNQEGSNDTLTDASIAAFDRALELATLDRHGPTVKLIGALWATVGACCYAGGGYETLARELLEPARALADAAPAIATLEDVLAAPDASRIGEAFAALPFNYR